MARLPLALAGLLLLASVAASGCLGGDAPREDTTPRYDTRPAPPPIDQEEAEKNVSRGQTKWHFHDAWGDDDVITLLDGEVYLPLNADSVGVGAVRSGRIEFTLPHGTLVPPEAGHLEVTVVFTPASGTPFTGLNLSHRAANADNFSNLGPIALATATSIPVDFFSADVPHAGASAWSFLLEATPDARGAAFANGTAEVTVTAHRAREVFLDPPHGVPYRTRHVVPIVPDVELTLTGAKLADGKYVVERDGAAQVQGALATVLPRNGSIVPESTKSVLVKVAWTGSAVTPVGVTYEEPNSPSAGALALLEEGTDFRLFGLDIDSKMTDSPYSFRSTWRFHLHVDGPAGPVPKLPVTVTAWVSDLPVQDAAAEIAPV